MSMFLCPLCGKQNSIKNYHPENFENDVEIFHNAGLGYRKGFEKILRFDIEEFPELRVQLQTRINMISDFLDLREDTQEKVLKLENELFDEKIKRILAEEELEELDIEPLLVKINKILGANFSEIHSAVDELISRAVNLNKSNKNLAAVNNNLQSRYTSLEQANKSLITERTQLINEKNDLTRQITNWDKAYKSLEKNKNQEISQYSDAYNNENRKRIQLEEYLVELDLDLLLIKMNDEIENEHTNLHYALNELIRDLNLRETEIKNAIDFINNTLPDYYETYDDLDEAIQAFYQYYEDYVEELEG